MSTSMGDPNPHKTAKANAKAAQAYAKATRPWYKKKRWWAAGLVLIFIIAGALGGGGDDTDTTAKEDSSSQSSDTDKKEAASSEETSEEKSEPTEEPEPEPTEEPEPEFTPAQEAAIRAAASYLDNMDFSRAGLYDQLTSEYGEQIKPKDAEFAIKQIESGTLTLDGERLTVNWQQEANDSAKSYLENGLVSSEAGLVDQLSSEYGEQFAYEVAVKAARNAFK